jgi:hypothetical protein
MSTAAVICNDLHVIKAPPPRMSRTVLCILALGSAVSALDACAENKAQPEDVLKKFLGDVRAHRSDQAWALLSESSRKELERRHREIAKAAAKSGDAAKGTLEEMLFEDLGLMMLNPPESVAVVSPPGPEATLRVTVKDGRSAEVRMVKEGAGWKVDLVGSLRKAPALEAELRGKTAETSTVP